ncbi:MAG: ABC transporter permease, partial [Parabacteroides sp.]|nr:ABC transporter permease [Parabacteroides sp.]
VMEEKTNRIVEIMISSVRPFDLMMGKIIGIGLVGLTQIFLWGVITVALVTVGTGMFGGGAEVDPALLAQSNLTPATQDVAQLTDSNVLALLASIDWRLMAICFLLYFVGGYILYASLFAAIGSAVDSQEDAQQFVAPMSVFMVFALYAGMYSIQNPDGPLAFWCSMIPLTSPIVMMVRLPFDVPSWQIALSIVLLYASFIGAVWVSGKIYRVGILMYGKKVNLKELLRWIRQVG